MAGEKPVPQPVHLSERAEDSLCCNSKGSDSTPVSNKTCNKHHLVEVGGISATGPVKRYAGRITPYVVLTCIVAASGGALFG